MHQRYYSKKFDPRIITTGLIDIRNQRVKMASGEIIGSIEVASNWNPISKSMYEYIKQENTRAAKSEFRSFNETYPR